MRCTLCDRPIEPRQAWRSTGNRFYCSEFCAESETAEMATAAPSLHQAHIAQRYERLERLLPYMRRYSHLAGAPAAKSAA